MNNAVKTALQAQAPALVASFERHTTRTFENLTGHFGANMKGVFNSVWAPNWAELRALCTVVNPTGKPDDRTYQLNAEAVRKAAEEYAQATIEAWEAKILGKMGNLQDAECKHLSGVDFMITGQRGDKKVAIQQTMILNVSPKGKLFNQFPARIYVNGKFTSEAAYKKM